VNLTWILNDFLFTYVVFGNKEKSFNFLHDRDQEIWDRHRAAVQGNPPILQSRSQGMPVRRLGLGIALEKSNKITNFIGWHQHRNVSVISAWIYTNYTRRAKQIYKTNDDM
jgi:hypothetical protein